MISRLDVSRWNGSVRLRFQSFAQHVRTVPLAGQVDDLAGTVELCVDPSGRVVGVHWPDERDAPAAVRPTARLDPVRNVAVVWLTDAAEEASASRHVVQPAGTALVYPLAVHTGADGRAVGFEFFAPRSALPESFVDELSAGSPEEEADTGDSTVDHRVATDAVGEETFAFHAGPLVWRTFAADLADTPGFAASSSRGAVRAVPCGGCSTTGWTSW